MELIVEQNLLYDFYGELLTAHQKEIYGEHILNDMTATEIAAEFGITRQGEDQRDPYLIQKAS